MLSYLFLLAAAASPGLLTVDLTPTEAKEIQELVAVLEQEKQDIPQEENNLTAPATALITITNAIQPSMLEYKHWTGKYSPEIFTVSVNGTDIATGATCEIPTTSSTIEIGYTYSFMNGMRTGGKKISYELNENTTQANITFDWKDNWRLILDNGKAIKEIVS